MKFFVKTLFLIASFAEIHAQISITGASPQCTVAVEKFNNSSNGQIFAKCGAMSQANDRSGFCEDSDCRNISFPSELKSACSAEPMDKLLMEQFEHAMSQVQDIIKQVCGDAPENKPTNAQISSNSNMIEGNNTAINPTNSNATSAASKLSYSLVSLFLYSF